MPIKFTPGMARRFKIPGPQRRNKYGAKRVELKSGEKFDSQGEAGRWLELQRDQRLGLITELERQPTWRIDHGGVFVCSIKMDFRYKDADGLVIVEDYKGKDNAMSRLKRKLLLAHHGVNTLITGPAAKKK
jgi:hypothetical protein